MNPLGLNLREEQQRIDERETDELLANEEGKFHIDEHTVVDFERKDIVIDDTGRLGEGGFSDGVYKGTFKHSTMDKCIPIAVKLMRIEDRQNRRNNLRGISERTHETKVLRKVANHKNVVALYGFVNYDMAFYMCMELMDASLLEVREIIYDSARGERMAKQQLEQFLGSVTVSVVDALAFFRNEARVIHGDLKPANVLLNDRGEVKLCDFGVSKKLQTAVTKTRADTNYVGTHSYMAPERFDSKTYGITRGYGSKSEVWSLGIMLIELATGVHPYGGIGETFLSDVITDASQQPPRLTDNEYSTRMRNFIDSCLFKSEADRSSVLPYIPDETTKPELPEETNNVQSKKFYTFNARRAQSDRNACVKEVLDHIRDGLPWIRSKIK
ncbi:hypothetical protein PRIPAC_76765 [Pristionchus pacificus]|uniref:mitogen-activated protein kinase kinase n=1 Tax=Pristionchus pacificus TaxID=54126 RepID=A0A2A6BXE1_PRIPA|nr:hypothetical protein PRIPAC_76765 [Pristionchus pacificus]|eukprot:PDM70433.1 protein kinase [Pristionchus pacificus]